MSFRDLVGSPGSYDSTVASSRVLPRKQRQRWRSEGMAVSDPLGPPGSCDSADLSHLPACLPEDGDSAARTKLLVCSMSVVVHIVVLMELG